MKRTISKTNATKTPKKSKKRVNSVTSASTVSAQKGKEVSPVRSPCICGSKACVNAREEWKQHFQHNYNDMIRFKIPRKDKEPQFVGKRSNEWLTALNVRINQDTVNNHDFTKPFQAQIAAWHFIPQALYREWDETHKKWSIKVFHIISEGDSHIMYPNKSERYNAKRDTAQIPAHIPRRYKNTAASAGVSVWLTKPSVTSKSDVSGKLFYKNVWKLHNTIPLNITTIYVMGEQPQPQKGQQKAQVQEGIKGWPSYESLGP